MGVSARSQIVGLIGHPVGHSASPAMHNAAFEALGLDWCYIPLPVAEPERVGEALRGLRALGMRGANVTVPHKLAVMPHLDHVTETARRIGAVNTVWIDDAGALRGDNTDGPGFIADLREHGVEPSEHRALVLGAGGAARAVICGLLEAGAPAITLLNRTPARAEALADALSSPAITAGALDDATLIRAADQSTLIINATRVGMSPEVDASPWRAAARMTPHHIVYDLVYNPRRTALLTQAEDAGARAIDGLGMLLHQGALALERWTGHAAPIGVMRGVLEARTKERNNAC